MLDSVVPRPLRSPLSLLFSLAVVSLACGEPEDIPPYLKEPRIPAPTPVLVARTTGLEEFAGVSPDQRKVAIILPSVVNSRTGPIHVWNMADDSMTLLGEDGLPPVFFDTRSERGVFLDGCAHQDWDFGCTVELWDFRTGAKIKLFEGVLDRSLRVSRDLEHVLGLVFTSRGIGKLVKWSAATGAAEDVAEQVFLDSLVLSPTGDRAVYATKNGEAETLFLLDLASSQSRELAKVQVTDPIRVRWPLFSQDGMAVAFSVNGGVGLYELATSRLTVVPMEKPGIPFHVSREGRSAIFFHVDLEAISGYVVTFWLMNREAERLVRIDDNVSLEKPTNRRKETDLGPSGALLVYHRYEDVFAYDLEADQRRFITRAPLPIDNWTPVELTFDSRKLLYLKKVADRERFQYRIFDLETSEDTPLSSPGRRYHMSHSRRVVATEEGHGWIDTSSGPPIPLDLMKFTNFETGTTSQAYSEMGNKEAPYLLNGFTFSPDDNIVAYERHYTIYYYDMVKKMATTAIDSTPSERHLGLPILPLDDKVVYIMLAPGRSGLYYAPVVR